MIKSFKRGMNLASTVAALALGSFYPNSASAQSVDIVNGQVSLAWDKSSGTNKIKEYRLYSGPVSRAYSYSSSAGTNTSVTVPLVLNKKTYYAATAKDMNNLESGYSSEVNIQPSNPSNMNATTVKSNGVNYYKISYNPSPVNSQYYFKLTTNSTAGYNNISSGSWSRINNLESRAISNITTVATIMVPAPATLPARTSFTPVKAANPSNLKLTPTYRGIDLAFNAADYNGLKNYYIYSTRLSDGFLTKTSILPTSTNGIVSRLITNLRTNSTYSFKVSGFVSTANGSYETSPTSNLNATFTGKNSSMALSSISEDLIQPENAPYIINMTNDGNGKGHLSFVQNGISDFMPHQLLNSTNLNDWELSLSYPKYQTNALDGSISGSFDVDLDENQLKYFKIQGNINLESDY